MEVKWTFDVLIVLNNLNLFSTTDFMLVEEFLLCTLYLIIIVVLFTMLSFLCAETALLCVFTLYVYQHIWYYPGVSIILLFSRMIIFLGICRCKQQQYLPLPCKVCGMLEKRSSHVCSLLPLLHGFSARSRTGRRMRNVGRAGLLPASNPDQ